MGLLGSIIIKGVETASKKAIINATENAAVAILSASSKVLENAGNGKDGNMYVCKT